MEQEKIKKNIAKNKAKAKQKDSKNIFVFRHGNDGKLHNNETPYKNYLGDHVKMRSVMAKLDFKLKKENEARKKSKDK